MQPLEVPFSKMAAPIIVSPEDFSIIVPLIVDWVKAVRLTIVNKIVTSKGSLSIVFICSKSELIDI